MERNSNNLQIFPPFLEQISGLKKLNCHFEEIIRI